MARSGSFMPQAYHCRVVLLNLYLPVGPFTIIFFSVELFIAHNQRTSLLAMKFKFFLFFLLLETQNFFEYFRDEKYAKLFHYNRCVVKQIQSKS